MANNWFQPIVPPVEPAKPLLVEVKKTPVGWFVLVRLAFLVFGSFLTCTSVIHMMCQGCLMALTQAGKGLIMVDHPITAQDMVLVTCELAFGLFFMVTGLRR